MPPICTAVIGAWYATFLHRHNRGVACRLSAPLFLCYILIITRPFQPHSLLSRGSFDHRCVLAYKYRKILEMLLTLMKFCQIIGAGNQRHAPLTRHHLLRARLPEKFPAPQAERRVHDVGGGAAAHVHADCARHGVLGASMPTL